jgi:PERQ amino acid-rich with GYF domain-containing protein
MEPRLVESWGRKLTHLPRTSRRTNGSTQTFRRPSSAQTASNSANQRDSASSTARSSLENPGVYIPPHRNGIVAAETRYSKDALLDLYRNMQDAHTLSDGLEGLYVSGWDPNHANGASSAPWGRRDDHGKDQQHGAEVCWEREGATLPLGLVDMTDEERDVSFERQYKLKTLY